MAAPRTLVRVPPRCRAGETIELSTLIAHPMETGYRVDAEGRPVPRDILRRYRCTLERAGRPPVVLFEAELHPAIAANPYLAFRIVARESGTLRFAWEGDAGFRHEQTAALVVDG
ncbi:thiosulfate oxidation carrier complex protein SoxZ [Piscinibacter sakaiensis]|uniref:Sulfur oxidation protein SoxZ n=1 Tax=Piscinibacter sakaiensis TaxID=1547922 RepID=A0A0K8P3B2_PISS1|nr:thiosulfate oxidation carrier complex protein SoxZ [Piscinibacter sakaiensis]GAP37136.1 sulfur oxidation protein SoxZ [Piscinibacter sakaiensis]